MKSFLTISLTTAFLSLNVASAFAQFVAAPPPKTGGGPSSRGTSSGQSAELGTSCSIVVLTKKKVHGHNVLIKKCRHLSSN